MTTRKRIEDELGVTGKTVPGEAGAFWTDFKARAPMYPQVEPARHSIVPRGVLGWGFGVAGVAILVAVLTLPLFWSNQTAKENVIHSLTVSPAFGAVFIVNDEASKATILWVDDEGVYGGKS